MKILSWNVNGIRAVYKKGFMEWFSQSKADIICVQETKADFFQFPQELKTIKGYELYLSSAEKKGYSGTAVWTHNKPKSASTVLGFKRLDAEGRLVHLEYGEFDLLNVYFPNGGASEERLRFKLDFYDNFLKYLILLKKKKRRLIICGDVNTAHQEIDLARPKANQDASGFLQIERDWISRLIAHGFIDTFRVFSDKGENYSWWDYKTRARDRNIGWRIDYFFISESLKNNLKKAFIEKDILGSDHCPVGIEIAV
jgi:exodeoxyribonuclease III